MGLSRQVYWSGLPFPPPGVLPNPGLLLARQILYHWATREALVHPVLSIITSLISGLSWKVTGISCTHSLASSSCTLPSSAHLPKTQGSQKWDLTLHLDRGRMSRTWWTVSGLPESSLFLSCRSLPPLTQCSHAGLPSPVPQLIFVHEAPSSWNILLQLLTVLLPWWLIW